MNTQRTHCISMNIPASQNQFHWCFSPPSILEIFCLPLLQTIFQIPSCFITKTWIADKVKAVKQNKQLYLLQILLCWHKSVWLSQKPFLFFETWMGSEELKHNENNSLYLSYRHKPIVRENITFYIYQHQGLVGIPYFRAYPHSTAVSRIILPRWNQLKK